MTFDLMLHVYTLKIEIFEKFSPEMKSIRISILFCTKQIDTILSENNTFKKISTCIYIKEKNEILIVHRLSLFITSQYPL